MSERIEDGALGPTGVSRRDFLKVGGSGALSLSLAGGKASGEQGRTDRAVIWLNLVGGPSQLETWDPKPDARSEVRGPFGSIGTSVPGVRINEFLPRLARKMDRLTLIRSMNHDAAPIHETGLQLLQTGRLSRPGVESPHFASVASEILGLPTSAAGWVVLPGPISNTGVSISRGQGPLDSIYGPEFLANRSYPTEFALRTLDLRAEREDVREAYGDHEFGRNCLRARRLVEAGTRVVTVNMFTKVFDEVSWDCHAHGPFSGLADYQREALPALDRGLSALIDDLQRRGLLDSTLIVAAGEFGRTPRLNAHGGRDHWPAAWSVALAGGGMSGGAVLGATDSEGAAPIDRPVGPEDLHATVLRFLGIDITGSIPLGDGRSLKLTDRGEPLIDLFA